ncbi:deoxyribodipyrimidine photolyase [Staphylococcus petrasii]|uniref:Deoxyribodipyrimidine photo-lyase n=1 Tax=Staphylococcus petrasii TaxID=1276936 RepID=A0A380G328_9STAP|nr:deoxyribodipyrimidine photo-lyase [Staphylococcus petrasii]PNZ28470.1 deoxyribodipyrimidine photo-lyase [Staphylococcus petrasii]TGE12981.1 deoxyribodipyrimidine photo-lyase [Staphylococcus petrasii]TGE18771.1 deoxyribodipyrimidine photo-lyase [Staphylococcus petrasii]SUM44927.1 deoxyribodipyrimidine photolyase [Staphylococcus petrasii]
MNIGVILNRVFRTQNNSLFEYISQQQNDIDQCYLIIPQEIFEEEGTEMKHNYYYGVLEKFLKELKKHDIEPFLIEYRELGDFCKEKQIEEVVVAGDIMSYHQESYDIRHLKQAFKKYDISVVTLRANHYFKPSTTMNKQGTPYKVFTSFYKAHRSSLRQHSAYDYKFKDIAKLCVKSQQTLNKDYSNDGLSEEQALNQWHDFLENDIQNYDSNREYLPEVLTSQLSIVLAYGLIDIKQIITELLESYEEDESNIEKFIRELMFREFYYVLMTQYPNTAHEAFNEKYRNIKWSYNKDDFKCWYEGKTGFPIIDAAMAELNKTGYMHNRMRMVVSQFLTKDLFIDWTWGEDYFRKKLIDFDSASNVHGWQWSASTGTDAVPYFRMFSPTRQSERFDKDALYIKKFIPELKDMTAKWLHEPLKHQSQLEKEGLKLGEDYPKPIVDHKSAREYVMSTFKSI